MKPNFLYFYFLLMGAIGCNGHVAEKEENNKDIQKWKSLVVTATAYNSVSGQTRGNPRITAWGDTLKPGTNSIAVSRDLIKKGLRPGTKVVIEGLDGIYIVNDKMNSRWRNKIDIYMGTNKQKAIKWGNRTVEICFNPSADAFQK